MSFSDIGGNQPVDPYSADAAAFDASQNSQKGRDHGRSRSRSRSPPPRSRRSPAAPSSKRFGGPGANRQAVNPSTVLGVFGLSIRTQERDLEDEFSRFGKVDKVTIVYDQRSDRSRGFGFIKMSNLEDAARCIQELNGLDLHGRRIRVDYSVTERAHAPTPGQYMGHRTSRNDSYHGDRDRDHRSSRYDGDRYDRDRHDRDRGYDRDRYDRDRYDRDRDVYGRDRDRRSPRRRSPERRSRRSYSRSPPRGGYSSPPRREYDASGTSNANGNAHGDTGIKW